MGRKSKEKSFLGSASRRRTVLQIEPVSRRREAEATHPSSNVREVNPTTISGIGLLGQYADNSDDEEQTARSSDENESGAVNNTVAKNTQSDQGNEVQIDSKLVDFFKEIEAISTNDANTAGSPDATEETSCIGEVQQEQQPEPNAADRNIDVGYTVPYPWQEVCDPNTNYAYYWNTLTNEVVWEMPQVTAADPSEFPIRDPQQSDEQSSSICPPGTSGSPEDTPQLLEETADQFPVLPVSPRPPAEPLENASPKHQPEPPCSEPFDKEMPSSPCDSHQSVPSVVDEPDADCEVSKPDLDGARDSPTIEPALEAKNHLASTVIDMFESEIQGIEQSATESDSTAEQCPSKEFEDDVAEEMPEYPPTPVNLSGSPHDSPDVLDRGVDDQYVVLDDWCDSENQDEDEVEQDERSKKEVLSEDEDADEIPSKKARYDTDSEQESEEDFAEKLLEEFLEGKSEEVEASVDDMEVESDDEDKVSLDDSTGVLLPPEAFQHNMADDTASRHEKDSQEEDASAQLQTTTDKIKDEKDEKLTTEIYDLCALLSNKLEFLNITKDGLSKLQLVLLQMETRIKDWREGGLSSQYLVKRLREADEDLKGHEKSAAPDGWSCHWDSSYKRYFYTDDATGNSQWDYPQAPVIPETTSATTTTMASLTDNATSEGLWGTSTMVQSTAATYNMLTTSSLAQSTAATYNMLTAPVDQSQVFATNTSAPATYPTATPENAVSSVVITQDPYRLDDSTPPRPDDDDVREHPDGSETPPPPGESPPPPPPPPEQPSVPTPPPPPPQDDAIVTVVPPPPPPPILPPPADSLTSDSVDQTALGPGLAVQAAPVHFIRAQRTLLDYSDLEPTLAGGESPDARVVMETQVDSSNNSRSSPVPMTAAGSKIKKKKSKSSVPMRSSKVKKMSSLVQKWQAIKKQDEVSSGEESDEEDHAAKSEAQIQLWRKEQITSGQAAKNPNFQEIKGDWRERVRKAKLRATAPPKVDQQNP